MSSHAKLSTSSRVLTALAMLLILSFAIAILPSTSDAKRPKKETLTPKNEQVLTDSSVHDTAVPSPDDYVWVDVEPEVIHTEPPVYPEELKDQLAGAELWVKAGVDVRGVVRGVLIVRSSGIPALDEVIVAAAWKNRYIPARREGKPVAAWVTYPVRFSETKESPSQSDTTLQAITDSVEVDTMPEMIYQPPPVYPREAKMSGSTGTVWIRTLVDNTGKVRAVEVQKSSGHKSLDNATTDSAWKNRFIPARKDGQSVAVWVTYKVDFKLSKK